MASNPISMASDPADATVSRHRLADIEQELGDLPRDAFAERIALTDEADVLHKALLQIDPEVVAEAKAKWAGRAGRKGLHEIDPEIAKGIAISKGYGDGGSGGSA